MEQNRSEECLVVEAAKGDEEAMSKLVVRYTPTAFAKATRYNNLSPAFDTEDFLQEALLGLLAAICTFRQGEAEFSTYANVCMDNRLANVAASAQKKRNVPPAVLVPLEQAENAADSDLGPEASVVAASSADKIVSMFSATLSDFEQRVFRQHLAGASYTEIASVLSSNEKAVDNAIQRARKKLKAALGGTI